MAATGKKEKTPKKYATPSTEKKKDSGFKIKQNTPVKISVDEMWTVGDLRRVLELYANDTPINLKLAVNTDTAPAGNASEDTSDHEDLVDIPEAMRVFAEYVLKYPNDHVKDVIANMSEDLGYNDLWFNETLEEIHNSSGEDGLKEALYKNMLTVIGRVLLEMVVDDMKHDLDADFDSVRDHDEEPPCSDLSETEFYLFERIVQCDIKSRLRFTFRGEKFFDGHRKGAFLTNEEKAILMKVFVPEDASKITIKNPSVYTAILEFTHHEHGPFTPCDDCTVPAMFDCRDGRDIPEEKSSESKEDKCEPAPNAQCIPDDEDDD